MSIFLYPWCEIHPLEQWSGSVVNFTTTNDLSQRTLKRLFRWVKRGAGTRPHLWGAYVHVYQFMSSDGFGVQVNKMFMCAS